MSTIKQTITADDLYRMQLITAAEQSPDGKYVISAVQSVDKETEKKYSNLHLTDTKSKETIKFTNGKQSDTVPKWSPDGLSIIFLSNRDDEKQPQFYKIPTNGGEAQKVSSLTGEIGDYLITSNGKTIYFQFRKKDQADINREKDEQTKKLGIISREINRTFYRLDGYGYLPKERWHLWELNIEDGTTRQLTNHEIYDETDPFLSPDEKTLGFFSNRTPDPDLDHDVSDLYLLDLTTLEFNKMETPEGPKNHGAFSPDGTWILYTGQNGKGQDWKNNDLWIIPADGSSHAINLTHQFDINVNGGAINDVGTLPDITPIWSNDNQFIYYQVGQFGDGKFEKINIHTKQRETLINRKGVVGGVNFDKKQSQATFIFGQAMELPQLYIIPSGQPQNKITQLTHFNESWLNQLDLGEVEEVWFKGSDHNDLQGWILKPPSFDPQKKYPSILEIHGGPLTQYGNLFMHEFYFLAAKGYVVYFTNPRGGQGYGEEHAKAIYDGKWGIKDYEDLMAWVDIVENLPYIDKTRMGVTGGSYGGYMTNWIIGHTDRFNAAVTQRCVSNLISMWGSSDFNHAFQQIFGNQAPYQSIETLWECSPMKYIGNAKTPTLVIHSEQDLRCPLEQGQQVFTALKTMGVDTKFVIFPDEPHGLSRMGRTDRRIKRLNEIAAWFDHYLCE
ncbi:MAG: hypothetical protein CL609_01465 [Anaerolineaceae bacterium]|nr:hypothetical protein [Anaerolineaceae bacterium]